MAGNYDYSQAYQQCKKVDAVREECIAALRTLQTVKGEVSDNWSGQAGKAMLQALEQKEEVLANIISRLGSMSSTMKNLAWQQELVSRAENEES